jgi:hypothetical protein
MFNKKKGMIDVVEMHRRGMVIAPKRDPEIDRFKMGRDGFVELKKDVIDSGSNILSSLPESSEPIVSSPASTQDNIGFPNFFDFNASSSGSSVGSDLSSSPSSNMDVYEKREVDERVEKLDNLIYKLEQRILELEKKLGVNGSNW